MKEAQKHYYQKRKKAGTQFPLECYIHAGKEEALHQKVAVATPYITIVGKSCFFQRSSLIKTKRLRLVVGETSGSSGSYYSTECEETEYRDYAAVQKNGNSVPAHASVPSMLKGKKGYKALRLRNLPTHKEELYSTITGTPCTAPNEALL